MSVLCVFMLRAQAEAEKPETSSWHLSESESSTHDSVDTAFVILQCLQPHKSWPEILYPQKLYGDLQELAGNWRRCSRLLWAFWRKAA